MSEVRGQRSEMRGSYQVTSWSSSRHSLTSDCRKSGSRVRETRHPITARDLSTDTGSGSRSSRFKPASLPVDSPVEEGSVCRPGPDQQV